MKREIEVLWPLNDTIEVAMEKLQGAEFKQEKRIVDHYLYDPMRKTLQPNESGRLAASMRLRIADNECSIAYKHDHFEDDVWVYSDEFETSVGDAEKARGLLHKLGLIPLVTVAVNKRYFHSGPYEITLEEVDGLGAYLEVEYIHEDDGRNAHDVKEEIRRYVEKMGLHVGEEENAGKPELLLRKQLSEQTKSKLSS